jgi:hypothetical protein
VTTSANLELVRSIGAAFERGDFFSAAERLDPESEFVIADGPEPASLKGASACLEWARDFLSAWEGFSLKIDEYRELADERVLMLVHSGGGRGQSSGLELGQLGGGGAAIFDIRAGKVTRVVIYFNRERGLADLGLAPEAS